MRTLVATNIKQSFAKLVENNTAVDATFALLAGQDPAAFHALHSLLAMEGHVIFDSTFWPLPSRRSEGFADHRYVAILTKNNKWIIERRSRNHHAVWAEVAQVFATRLDELPECFRGLFDYMYQRQFEERFTLDVLADVLERTPLDDFSGRRLDEFRVKLSDRLPEFLQRISETRHRSIYESFGSDPYVHEAICNQEAFSSTGMEDQSLEYGRFCESLLTDVACNVLRTSESMTVSKEIAVAVFLTTYMTPFDEPQIDRIGSAKLKDTLARIHDWIIHPVERSSDVSS